MRRTDTFKLQAFHVPLLGYLGQFQAWNMICVTNRIISLLVCINKPNDKVGLCKRPDGTYTCSPGNGSCWKSSPKRPTLGQSLTELSPKLQTVTGLRNWTESKIRGHKMIKYIWNCTSFTDISSLFTDCQSLYNLSLFKESRFGPSLASKRGNADTVQRRAALWLWEAGRLWNYREYTDRGKFTRHSMFKQLTQLVYENFVFVTKYSKEFRRDLHNASMEKGET
jgi:hypothetical protein